jgi:hypothetical protein
MLYQLPIQFPRRQRLDPAGERVVASTSLLARLEAAGGGYQDHDIRSSDNHSRILSEAGGPEEACQRQASVPAVFNQRRARHTTVLRRDPDCGLRRDPDYGRRRSGISTCWYIVDKLVQNPDLPCGSCNFLE